MEGTIAVGYFRVGVQASLRTISLLSGLSKNRSMTTVLSRESADAADPGVEE